MSCFCFDLLRVDRVVGIHTQKKERKKITMEISTAPCLLKILQPKVHTKVIKTTITSHTHTYTHTSSFKNYMPPKYTCQKAEKLGKEVDRCNKKKEHEVIRKAGHEGPKKLIFTIPRADEDKINKSNIYYRGPFQFETTPRDHRSHCHYISQC